jgi:hypothetical protein
MRREIACDITIQLENLIFNIAPLARTMNSAKCAENFEQLSTRIPMSRARSRCRFDAGLLEVRMDAMRTFFKKRRPIVI